MTYGMYSQTSDVVSCGLAGLAQLDVPGSSCALYGASRGEGRLSIGGNCVPYGIMNHSTLGDYIHFIVQDATELSHSTGSNYQHIR
jgi:hypothetical protein